MIIFYSVEMMVEAEGGKRERAKLRDWGKTELGRRRQTLDCM